MAFNLSSRFFFVSVAETSILISTYKTHHTVSYHTALHSFIIHTCSWCKKLATNHEQNIRVKLKFSAAELRKAVSEFQLINSNVTKLFEISISKSKC